jgi:hypothetical protein
MTDPVNKLRDSLLAVQAELLPIFTVPFTCLPPGPGRDLIRWTPGKGFTVNGVKLEHALQRELCFLSEHLPEVTREGRRAVEAELQRVRAATDRAQEVLALIRKAADPDS